MGTSIKDIIMVRCLNEKCAHCMKYYDGSLVCGLPYEPTLQRWSKDMRADVVRCLSYKLKQSKKMEEFEPGRLEDGSYSGQLKGE